jgi:hypothetical protein
VTFLDKNNLPDFIFTYKHIVILDVLGQLLAIQVQFGLVFALFSAFVLMFLQLGVRAEGEMSVSYLHYCKIPGISGLLRIQPQL